LIDLTFCVVMLMTVVQSVVLAALFRIGLFQAPEAASAPIAVEI
jgi:hypothetical protein